VVVSALIAVTGGYGPPEPVSLAFYIPWDVAYVGVNVLLGVGYVLIIAAFARGLPGVDVVAATIDEPAPDEGAPASP